MAAELGEDASEFARRLWLAMAEEKKQRAEIAALERELAALERELAALERELAALERELADLRAKKRG